jgi:hypothetical protein
MRFLTIFSVATLPLLTQSQFITPSSFTNVISSPIDPNIIISFQQPSAGTCQTIFGYQKQYTGYVTLPRNTIYPVEQDYAINTFFWFVEARQNSSSAPLTIFMNGGPGSSSLIGMFQEVGPCEVIAQKDGSFGTQPRLWGWDRTSNILVIDQPVQTGLSFDTALVNSFVEDILLL